MQLGSSVADKIFPIQPHLSLCNLSQRGQNSNSINYTILLHKLHSEFLFRRHCINRWELTVSTNLVSTTFCGSWGDSGVGSTYSICVFRCLVWRLHLDSPPWFTISSRLWLPRERKWVSITLPSFCPGSIHYSEFVSQMYDVTNAPSTILPRKKRVPVLCFRSLPRIICLLNQASEPPAEHVCSSL